MKYRYLTYEELDVMREDFSHFLYKHGFSRFDYKVLQEQHSEQAVNLLGRYSDQTFDKVMQGVEYLEYRTPKQLITSQCQSDQLIIIGIEAPIYSNLDFTNLASLQYLPQKDLGGFKCFKEKRPYSLNRENELFQMIEAGHFVVDETNFAYLDGLRQSFQN